MVISEANSWLLPKCQQESRVRLPANARKAKTLSDRRLLEYVGWRHDGTSFPTGLVGFILSSKPVWVNHLLAHASRRATGYEAASRRLESIMNPTGCFRRRR